MLNLVMTSKLLNCWITFGVEIFHQLERGAAVTSARLCLKLASISTLPQNIKLQFQILGELAVTFFVTPYMGIVQDLS